MNIITVFSNNVYTVVRGVPTPAEPSEDKWLLFDVPSLKKFEHTLVV